LLPQFWLAVAINKGVSVAPIGFYLFDRLIRFGTMDAILRRRASCWNRARWNRSSIVSQEFFFGVF
jgi:hypothetical protein